MTKHYMVCLLAFLSLASSAVAVEDSPEWTRCDFRELYWLGYNTISGDVGSWIKGDGTEKWPKSVGRIEDDQIIYRSKIYAIESHGAHPVHKDAYVIVASGLTITIQPVKELRHGVLKIETKDYIEVISPFGGIDALRNNSATYRWLLAK